MTLGGGAGEAAGGLMTLTLELWQNYIFLIICRTGLIMQLIFLEIEVAKMFIM